MDDVAAGVFNALFDDGAIAMTVRKPRSQDFSERRVLLKRDNMLVLNLTLFDPPPDFLCQIGR